MGGKLSAALVSQTSTAAILEWYCVKIATRGVASSPHAADSFHTHQSSTTCGARSLGFL